MTKAPPLEESKKPEPPVLLENTELRMEQLPPLITIPAPKTPKLEPPTRNELLSITQFVKEDEQLLLRTPAPNASSSVLVQSALLKVNLQLAKLVAIRSQQLCALGKSESLRAVTAVVGYMTGGLIG